MQAVQKCIDNIPAVTPKRGDVAAAAASPSRAASGHVPGSRRSFTASAESPGSSSFVAMYKAPTESSIAHHSPNSYSASSAESTPTRHRRREGVAAASPRSVSNDKYSSRFSAENAGDGSSRSTSEPRRKSSANDPNASPEKRFSSTWPYASPQASPTAATADDAEQERAARGARSRSSSRGPRTAPRSRSSSQNRGNGSRRSSVSDLIDEQEGPRPQRELTDEEQRELDNVQVNIRRIHRKSITDSVSIAKLPHLDKFEQQAQHGEETPERRPSLGAREKRRTRSEAEAPVQKQEEQSVSASRELFSAAGRTRSPGRSRSPGRHSWTPSGKKASEEPSKAPAAPRAPSAKIKDKSRSKSPRPKSPPPKRTTRSDDYFDSLERWKENRWVGTQPDHFPLSQ